MGSADEIRMEQWPLFVFSSLDHESIGTCILLFA
jgi:hypothetical protein